MPFLRNISVLSFCFLWLIACSKRNYNVDAETLAPQTEEKSRFGFLKGKKTDNPSLADTAKPDLAVATDSTLYNDPGKKKKQLKKAKKSFLGYAIKKGYTKRGKGKNATIEIFHYLPEYKEPSAYAPRKYYYNTRRKVILTASTIDPKQARILHGPYKKMQGKNLMEEGFYYIGTKHLRWETYDRNFILRNKVHYEKGFPRDAIINYYDAAQTRIKEVIPYADGKLHGDYVMFLESGLRAWDGQYDNGKKVGVWIEYWPFRNRKHYEYQYPETAEDEQFEPFLLREYDRQNGLIYEKGKIDKRPKAQL